MDAGKLRTLHTATWYLFPPLPTVFSLLTIIFGFRREKNFIVWGRTKCGKTAIGIAGEEIQNKGIFSFLSRVSWQCFLLAPLTIFSSKERGLIIICSSGDASPVQSRHYYYYWQLARAAEIPTCTRKDSFETKNMDGSMTYI